MNLKIILDNDRGKDEGSMREEHKNDHEATNDITTSYSFEPPKALKRTQSGELKPLIHANPENFFIFSKNGTLYPLDHDLDFDLDEIEPIAQGGESKIYAALFQFTNKQDEIEQRRCIFRSMGVVKKTDHSSSIEELITSSKMSSDDCGLLKHMGNVVHRNERFAVFPFCELFLKKIMTELPAKKENNPFLYQAIVLHIFTGILKSLKYMHEQGYAHRDLKPDNIAYYRGKIVFLDFGVSTKLNAKTAYAGTPGYTHPYCSLDENFSSAPNNDIYAAGQILKEMLGTMPELLRRINMKDPSVSSMGGVHNEHEKKYQAALDKEARVKAAFDKILEIDPTVKRGHRGVPDIVSDNNLDFEQKLEKIAILMTNLLPDHQPSVDAIYNACEDLKQQLEATLPSTLSQEELDQGIMDFYEQLSEKGPFPEAFSPRKLSIGSMERVSSFSVSFFSTSQRSYLSNMPSPSNIDKQKGLDNQKEKTDVDLSDSWLMPDSIQP